MFESANLASDHQQTHHGHAEAGRREARPRLPAAREALRGRQRLGQARQLLVRQRHAGQPARSRRDPARERAVPGVLRRRHPRRAQVRRHPARGDRHRQQRSPPGRQRSAAGHHLDLPRRAADGRLRADQGGRRQVVEDRRARWRSASTRCPSCRATRAIATAPARSPSPATGSSSAPSAPASRSATRWWRSTRSSPSRSTPSRPSWRPPSPAARS